MCFMKSPKIETPAIAAMDNTEALQQADMEARLRRKRRGAAATVLTSPTGIPTSSKMGEVAQ